MEQPTVNEYGNKVWKNDLGQVHRDGGPAIELKNGSCFWYQNDKLHNANGPAVIQANGDVRYYFEGKLHKDNGPAMVFVNGDVIFYKNGKTHKEDGPACVYKNSFNWYLNGRQYYTEASYNLAISKR